MIDIEIEVGIVLKKKKNREWSKIKHKIREEVNTMVYTLGE